MSQHTPSPSRRKSHRHLPRGRAKLIALEVAINLTKAIAKIRFPKGTSHLRDHLVRAADNTALRLSEASGRTQGNRYQHLEGAYAENQDVTITNVTLRFESSAKLPVRPRLRKANQLVAENLESLREELASIKGRSKLSSQEGRSVNE